MEQKSILEGIGEHDVVTVQNPFDAPFEAKLARSVVVKLNRNGGQPTGNANADAFMQGIHRGIDTGGHESRQHVQQTIPFSPKQTLRLPGDVARVVVNQMVRKYLQDQSRAVKASRGLKTNAIMIADSVSYMETEKLIVLNHENMLSKLNVETVEQRLQRQLDDLNQPEAIEQTEVKDEQPFPTESGAGTVGSQEATATTRGRKAQPAA